MAADAIDATAIKLDALGTQEPADTSKDDLCDVRRLAADARWLDAFDALDALESPAPETAEDVDLVEEVRARGASFRRARALCSADADAADADGAATADGAVPAAAAATADGAAPAAAAATAEEAWSEGHRAFGVETSYRYDADGLLWLRTTGEMKDIDLFHTVAVIREIGLFGEWIPFLRHSDVVHELDFSRLLAHFSIGVRGVLSRDCVMRVAACNDALSSGALYFEGESLADDVAAWRGAAVPPRYTGWGYDRMHVHSLVAKVAFTSATSQHAMVVVSVDLRTRLPRSILDFFLKKLVGIFLWLWRRQSRYISAHDEGKHRDAIAADAAFYENWLRPKYDEFCAARGWTDTSPALGADDAEDEVGDDAALPPGLDGADDGGAADSPAPAVGDDAAG